MIIFPMYKLRSINFEWRWLDSSMPNYASFHVVNHTLRVFKGCRHMWWFKSKVLLKYNQYLEILKTQVLWPSHMLLQPLVLLFANLSLKEMVALKDTLQKAKYGNFGANALVVVCMYFPPKARLFRSPKRLALLYRDDKYLSSPGCNSILFPHKVCFHIYKAIVTFGHWVLKKWAHLERL